MYAPDDHHFSKIIKGHSADYGPVAVWLAFQQTIFGFTERKKFTVVTDIANYYDFISYDHLRSVLSDLSLAREHSLDLLIYTLSHMLWQPDYMPRVQIGLPQIHLDGARLLAHAFLFEIDRFLVSNSRIEYARYMDDIDIGVDTVVEAKAVIRDLDLSLQTRQLRLNSGKTKILNEKEARRHFRIRENMYLDKFESIIDDKLTLGEDISKDKELLAKAIFRGLSQRRFYDGNGEKILKRIINYSRQYKSVVDSGSFVEILRNWPGCRKITLLWWHESEAPDKQLQLLKEFIEGGHVIDHVTCIDVAVSIVSARLPFLAPITTLLQEICAAIDVNSKWGFFAVVWILSKYGTEDQLFGIIDRGEAVWSTNEHLSRTAASVYPRFIGKAHERPFLGMIRRANLWARSALQFQIGLSSTVDGVTSVKKFVGATNPSLPNRITHSKFLMLLGALKNPKVAPNLTASLRTIHAQALSDPHYALVAN